MIQRFRVSSYGKLVGFLCNVFIVSVPIPLFPKFAFIRRIYIYRPYFISALFCARDTIRLSRERFGFDTARIIVRNEGRFSSSIFSK